MQVTADIVPVAFHDFTLGTSGKVYQNGAVVPTSNTTKISDLTLSELDAYDFGIYANEMFAGTKIATLEDHVKQAKLLGYSLDLELKENITSMSDSTLQTIFNIVAKYGMLDSVTWGCYKLTSLTWFKTSFPKSSLCYEIGTLSKSKIDEAKALNNDINSVYIYWDNSDFVNNFTDELREYASICGVKLENGNPSQVIDIPYYVERLDKVECAYVDYPVSKLL